MNGQDCTRLLPPQTAAAATNRLFFLLASLCRPSSFAPPPPVGAQATLLLEAVSGDSLLSTTYGERQHTLLHAAALGGNANILKAMLAKRKQQQQSTAAAAASKNNNNNNNDSSRCDFGARDVVGRTPMHLAAMRGNAAVARALLRAGGHAEVVDVLGRTPLHIACELGHGELATDLLFCGAKVGTRDTDGLTPLHLAARGGHTAALGLLLRAFADPEERTPPSLLLGGGLSALDLATNNGKIETMAHLLAGGGCEVDGRDPVTHTTALHHAAGNQRHGEAAMKVLLEAGASVDSVGKIHGTPLHRAVCVGFPGGVRALLRAGADENATDGHSGETPLSMLERHHPQVPMISVDGRGRIAVVGSIFAADAQEIRGLLTRAPADRAWRRRGWLVMLRARELSAATATAMAVVAETPALQVEIKKEEGRRRQIQRQERQGQGQTNVGGGGRGRDRVGGISMERAAAGPEATERRRPATAPLGSEGRRSCSGAVHLLLELAEPDAFEAVVAFL